MIARMKFRTAKSGRALLDVLTDEEHGLRLIVSRLGAELVSLARRDAEGIGSASFIATTRSSKPAKGWANHATVMGYFLHRIKNERSLYRGQEIRGGTHSFLRAQALCGCQRGSWCSEDASLTYRISPNEIRADGISAQGFARAHLHFAGRRAGGRVSISKITSPN